MLANKVLVLVSRLLVVAELTVSFVYRRCKRYKQKWPRVYASK